MAATIDPLSMFLATVKVDVLDRKHPEYRGAVWSELRMMYSDEEAMCENASLFLTRRTKEPSEVYRSRCARFGYTNILAQGIGWYVSKVFADAPDIDQKKGGQLVDLESKANAFYTEFQRDCDRRGTLFTSFWRDMLANLLVYGRSFVLVDLPPQPVEAQPASRAEQDLRPYLVSYLPEQVINWSEDSYGNLNWAIVSVTSTDSGLGFPPEPRIVDRWYYFGPEVFAVYERSYQPGEDAPTDAALMSAGRHALAYLGEVPLRRFVAPDGLWFGKRARLQIRRHVDAENALDWGLLLSALAVFYIKGEFDDEVTIAEHAYLKLAADGDAGWLVPDSAAHEMQKERIQQLKENIFGSMYLLAQARSTDATPAAQSGVSKEADMQPSSEVCQAIGDIVRESMQTILRDVAVARDGKDSEREFSVRGFEFKDADELGQMQVIEQVQRMSVPSDTLAMELNVRIAKLSLPDASPELLETIEEEIRSAPTQSAMDQQKRDDRMAALQASFYMAAPAPEIAAPGSKPAGKPAAAPASKPGKPGSEVQQ